MNIYDLRKQFPHTDETIYLNHAATGPLSRPVKAAIEQYVEQRHRSHINNYEPVQARIAEIRERIAQMLGTGAGRIAFMPNTSSALNVPALGLDWKEGDRIAVPGCEFPANVYPFLNLERKGVTVDFIPHRQGTITLEDVEQTLRPETKLLSISWVQFLSGFRADLKAVSDLCHSRGVLCCVDAIQGLGALQLDVEATGIDFLACGAHKWLMGTQGVGFLYITEEFQNRLDPPMAGWLHGPIDWEHLCDYRLSFHDDASRFHLGTPDSIGIVALHAALGLYFEADPAWCEAQVLERAGQLWEGLDALHLERYGSPDRQHASGIITIHHSDPEGLQDYLAENDVQVAVRNGKVRFSPTYYNASEEIDYVLERVDAYQRNKTPV